MKAIRCSIYVTIILIGGLSSTSISQPSTLRRASSIELNFGLWSHLSAGSQISSSGIMQEAKSGGVVGGLTYSYWMRENLAVTISGALISAEATSSVTPQTLMLSSLRIAAPAVEQNANSIVSLLLGVRYYVPAPEAEDAIRPYVALSAGSYMGHEASSSLFVQTAHSESAFGGRLGAGVDLFLGESVKLGVAAGYNVMTDFSIPVGARTNYNGADASMGIGYIF